MTKNLNRESNSFGYTLLVLGLLVIASYWFVNRDSPNIPTKQEQVDKSLEMLPYIKEELETNWGAGGFKPTDVSYDRKSGAYVFEFEKRIWGYFSIESKRQFVDDCYDLVQRLRITTVPVEVHINGSLVGLKKDWNHSPTVWDD